jgi:hypothetical protein
MAHKFTYKGEILTGTICRQNAYAGGAQHFILKGEFLCPSSMNLHNNDLIINVYSAKVKSCESALPYVSCKKCNKKLSELIETTKAKAEKVGA